MNGPSHSDLISPSIQSSSKNGYRPVLGLEKWKSKLIKARREEQGGRLCWQALNIKQKSERQEIKWFTTIQATVPPARDSVANLSNSPDRGLATQVFLFTDWTTTRTRARESATTTQLQFSSTTNKTTWLPSSTKCPSSLSSSSMPSSVSLEAFPWSSLKHSMKPFGRK